MKLPSSPRGNSRRIDQLQVNGCRWLGDFHNNPSEYIAGQTFQIAQSGKLDTISIYCEMVHREGLVKMSFHQFDEKTRQWGPALVSSELELKKLKDPAWVQFKLGDLPLDSNHRYGFRLQTQDALVALGEAVWGNDKTDLHGEEWISRGNDRDGHYFRYFSLVYSVGLN